MSTAEVQLIVNIHHHTVTNFLFNLYYFFFFKDYKCVCVHSGWVGAGGGEVVGEGERASAKQGPHPA